MTTLYEKFLDNYFQYDNTEKYLNASEEEKKTFWESLFSEGNSNLCVQFNHVSHNGTMKETLLKDLISQKEFDFFKHNNCIILFFDIVIDEYFLEDEEEKAIELIEFSLKHHMPVDLMRFDAPIPLIHYTACFGFLKSTKWLCEKGANLNFIDNIGESILDSTMTNDEYIDVFKYLFNLPNINLKNSHGYIVEAFNQNYKKTINLIKKSELVNDIEFMQKALSHCDEPQDEFLAWLEKNQLEKSMNSKQNQTKKIKL